jgi:hypothetical protein
MASPPKNSSANSVKNTARPFGDNFPMFFDFPFYVSAALFIFGRWSSLLTTSRFNLMRRSTMATRLAAHQLSPTASSQREDVEGVEPSHPCNVSNAQ